MQYVLFFLRNFFHLIEGPSCSCRFVPTCSEFALEAFQKKGIIQGLFLTSYRILKCHPFGKYGYDPVEKRN